ncbi:hypothetical protein [Terrarubrum flagellatum]|uniref:hypothetical protein n=1 Tax=Terrirubrum flagellatum TaxID=2895980 RepID=UPI003144F798
MPIPAPSPAVLSFLTASNCIAVFLARADDEIEIGVATDPWSEGPVLVLAWAYGRDKAETVAERLKREIAILDNPDAFLGAFERLAITAGARLHRVVIAAAEAQTGENDWARNASGRNPLNREYKRLRMSGGTTLSYNEFVKERMAQAV